MSSKVIIVSHGFQQHYERGFVNGLAMNNVPVCLIASDDTDVIASVQAINLRGSQGTNRSRVEKALNLMRYHLRLMLFVLTNRGAVVHVIGQFPHAIAMGIVENLLHRMVAKRLVITVHNLLPHNRHTRWNKLVYRCIWHTANSLVVHTDRMKRDLEEQFGVPPERISVMEHGVNDEVGVHSTHRSCDRLAVEIQLLFFGKVVAYKGIDVLLEAFDGLDDRFGLFIAGSCDDPSFTRRIESQIARNRHRDRIRWCNAFIPEEDVAGCFAAADALVLPYRHIDQSGVLFQAMKHGLPVVATNVGSLASYVTADIGVLVERADPVALRDGLLRFAEIRGSLRRSVIIERSRQFLWSGTVKSILKLYQ